MNIAELRSSLIENEQAIVKMEQASAQYPGLLFNLESHKRLQENLEREFASAADEQWIDVCSYRVFAEEGEPKLLAVLDALKNFQSLFTLVYDALVSKKPKYNARFSPEAIAATTFGFGYSFLGSLGVALTLPNQRVLVDSSDLDRAVDKVFEMTRANSSDQVAMFSKELGTGAVRELYKWVSSQTESGVGSDIDWRRNNEVRTSTFVQLSELVNLKSAILETSDKTVETIRVQGTLVGVDHKAHTFHMTFDDRTEIRGRMSERIGKIETPVFYTVDIEQVSVVNYATDERSESFQLMDIVTPDQTPKVS